MKFTTLYFVAILLIMVSCKTQQGAIVNYAQGPTDTSGKGLVMPEPTIQKGDLLSIKVYSTSARPDITDAPYNLPEQTVSGSTASNTAGFLVNVNGDIEYPRIGRLHVEGLSKLELAEIIRKRFENELSNPSVIIRFLNYSVTVLGEVRTPGRFAVPTERLTVLEALGMAGDVTDFGNKNSIQVAREKNGKVEFGSIDLTSKALFQSPYFRLQQNDVIFVEQNRRKSAQQERQETAQQIGIVTSIISTLAIIFSVIRR